MSGKLNYEAAKELSKLAIALCDGDAQSASITMFVGGAMLLAFHADGRSKEELESLLVDVMDKTVKVVSDIVLIPHKEH